MDKKELEYKLRKIGKEVPSKLKKEAIIKERPFEQQYEKLSRVVDTGKIDRRGLHGMTWREKVSDEARERLEKSLERSPISRTTEKIDPRRAAEIDAIVSAKIEKMRQTMSPEERAKAYRDHAQFMRSRKGR